MKEAHMPVKNLKELLDSHHKVSDKPATFDPFLSTINQCFDADTIEHVFQNLGLC